VADASASGPTRWPPGPPPTEEMVRDAVYGPAPAGGAAAPIDFALCRKIGREARDAVGRFAHLMGDWAPPPEATDEYVGLAILTECGAALRSVALPGGPSEAAIQAGENFTRYGPGYSPGVERTREMLRAAYAVDRTAAHPPTPAQEGE
jgi:hypothetical protein